jgi:hypothetical protein
MHKNLQRDFRDIRAEFDKWQKGQPSELAGAEHVQRAHLRLKEIATILSTQPGSKLLDPADVTALLNHLQTHAGAASASH